MSLPILKAGDIVCTHDDSWLSKAIRWSSETPGEDAESSHTGVMYDHSQVCEALWNVEIRELEPTLEERYVDIYRPQLTTSEMGIISCKLQEWEGEQYAWYKIGMHLGDTLVSKSVGLFGINWSPYFFRRLCQMDDYPICSWVAGYAFESVEPNYFGVPPWAAQPDDIHDHCKAAWHAGTMERLYTSPGW